MHNDIELNIMSRIELNFEECLASILQNTNEKLVQVFLSKFKRVIVLALSDKKEKDVMNQIDMLWEFCMHDKRDSKTKILILKIFLKLLNEVNAPNNQVKI